MSDDDPIRVFISYSHDSDEHKDRVLALADRLRSEGLHVQLDQFEIEVTPRWMVQQIEDSRFVIAVCTETYARRFAGRETSGGLGADWEGKTITQELYERRDSFVVPVFFDREESLHIPKVLRHLTYYPLFAGYDDLYRRLTDQHDTPAGPVGSIRKMPTRPRPGLQGRTPDPSTTDPGDRGDRNDEGSGDVLKPYREWAEDHYAHLQLIGLDAGDVRVCLDEIYVPLKVADRGRLGGHTLPDDFDADGPLGPGEIGVEEAMRQGTGHQGSGHQGSGHQGTVQHVLIFGEPGSGKTTALKKLHQACWTDPVALGLDPRTVPVFLRLRRLDESLLADDRGLKAVLDREIESISGRLTGMGEILWEHRHLLLLFDGLDEIADEGSRSKILQRIAWYLSLDDASGVCAVVSCRQAALPGSDADRERLFRAFEVRPLQDEQIHALVHLWFREMAAKGKITQDQAVDRVAKLRAALETREYSARNILELVSNPLLLTLLCVVVLVGDEVPKHRVRFYKRCLEVLLDRWPRHKQCESPVDFEATIRALGHLAYFLHSTGRRDDLLWTEAIGVFRSVFAGDRKSARAFLRWSLDKAGILSAAGEHTYGFVHLGIQEHLTATHLIEVPRALEILQGSVDAKWWREVFLQLSALSEVDGFAQLTRRLLFHTDLWERGSDLLKACIDETTHPDLSAFAEVLEGEDAQRQEAVLRMLWTARASLPSAIVEPVQRLATEGSDSLRTQASRLLQARAEISDSKNQVCLIYDAAAHQSRSEQLETLLSGSWGGCSVKCVQGAHESADEALEESAAAVVLLGPDDEWLGVGPLEKSYSELVWLVVRLPGERRGTVPKDLSHLEVWDWQLGNESALARRILGMVEGSEPLTDRALGFEMPRRSTTRSLSMTSTTRGLVEKSATRGLSATRKRRGSEPDPRAIVEKNFVESITDESLLYIPGGRFLMGDENLENSRPEHWVRLSEYWLARTPVTNRQYGLFLTEAGSEYEPSEWRNRRFNAADQPVVGVSLHDVTAYCEWLSSKSPTGRRFQLPSEAQWEFAARGMDRRTYPWGNEDPDERYACFGQDWQKGRPSPVGSFPQGAGPLGHLDLAGTVWEWCRDVWQDDYGERVEDEVDPLGGGASSLRPLRGGAWFYPASALRSAVRSRSGTDRRADLIGFRVSCALSGS